MYDNIIISSDNGGLNQNSLNDFTNVQCAYTPWNGEDYVMLWLFSPYTMGGQVSRPFVYQFTPELVDQIKQAPSLAYGVGPNGTKNPAAYSAILPDSTGMILNTSTLDSTWSFVLIINSAPRPVGAIVTPGFRKVAMGYTIGEPGTPDPNNPDKFLINPSAVLVFTHTSCRNIVRRVGLDAPSDGLIDNANQDVDYVNETAAMFYDQNVLLGTPKEIMQYANSDEARIGVMDYGPLQLNSVKAGGNDIRAINNDIKAPRQQLSTIMTAIDNGIDHSQESLPTLHKFLDHDEMYGANGNPMTRVEMAQNTAYNNMPSSTFLSFVTGIDTSKPITLGELDRLYPHMRTFPRIVNRQQYGWDISSQVGCNTSGQVAPIISARNQMSYLTASVLQAICGSLGIAQVAFSYMSRQPGAFSRQPMWHMDDFRLVVPRSVDIEKNIAFQFQRHMGNELLDVIYTLCGDFTMFVMANMGGDISINLMLENYPDAADGSFYQTSARFGGLMNPMIGTIPIINNNVMQLSNVTQTLVNNAFSEFTDMRGMSDMPLPEESISL